MVVQLCDRVGLLRGIHQLADLDDGLVIRGLNDANSIVGGEHERVLPVFEEIDCKPGRQTAYVLDIVLSSPARHN
jgi:hypothetical protein